MLWLLLGQSPKMAAPYTPPSTADNSPGNVLTIDPNNASITGFGTDAYFPGLSPDTRAESHDKSQLVDQKYVWWWSLRGRLAADRRQMTDRKIQAE